MTELIVSVKTCERALKLVNLTAGDAHTLVVTEAGLKHPLYGDFF
jgi:hypothetical protein